MNNKIILYGVVIFILIILAIGTFANTKFRAGSSTGNAVAGSSGKLDTTGWTDNEKMNYEMHGTVPSRLQGEVTASAVSSRTGIVAGDSDNIPEKCQLPAGQDINAWKEHLGHHAETQDCLQYFK